MKHPGREASMYQPKYYKDTHYIPVGSVVVFSQNTARTSDGEMVAGPPDPQESTMAIDPIATIDTPETSPLQETTELDKTDYRSVFMGCAVWWILAGIVFGICVGVHSLGFFAYCSSSSVSGSSYCLDRGYSYKPG